VEHSAAERHVGVVNICFQETFEDPSLQPLFPWISYCACAVTVISDTIIDLFYLLFTYLPNVVQANALEEQKK